MTDLAAADTGQYQTRNLEDGDFDAIACLVNQYQPGGVTGDILRRRNAIWDANDPRLRLVATNADNQIIGYCRSARRQSEPEGIFRINVYVDKDHCGNGLGLTLLNICESFTKEHGGRFPMTGVEETCARGLEFASKAGYKAVQHLFESKLDLEQFDASPYAIAQAMLEDQGYRFVSLDNLGTTDEIWEKLWQLDMVTDRDVPGSEFWSTGTLTEYRDRVEKDPGYFAGGIHVAIWQDQFVGMNFISTSPIEDRMLTEYTGVLREFRGKGIAQALKVLGIQAAQDLGKRWMITNNDDRNAPMLAVNRKLGFVEQPGFFIVRKELA